MTRIAKAISLALAGILTAGITLASGFKYDVKAAHEGGNVTPSQAFAMINENPEHTFIVDVRTRAEYELVGHPVGAYLIPYLFLTDDLREKKGKWEYGKSVNPNFKKDLLARFDPKTDTLLFMCRSGKRSCGSVKDAISAGWPTQRVFNILGGFEGDKIADKSSSFNGQRVLGGWRNEGLAWTYSLKKELLYQPDLAK